MDGKGVNQKTKFLYGPVSSNFCARRSVMMILNLSESLAKPAKLNMAYLSSLRNRAKLKKPSKTAVVLIAGVTISGTPCPRHITVPFLSSLRNRAKLKKPSKTAVVLIAGVTISGTPCPRHITVPFGAEAPSGHVAQA